MRRVKNELQSDRLREQIKKENQKRELAEKYGLEKSPMLDKLYNKAWDQGHSSGYSEVETCFADLMELIDVATPRILSLLASKFAWATETQLATLALLEGRLRSPKSDISRQTAIVKEMVSMCEELYNSSILLDHHLGRSPRLKIILSRKKDS